jgi:hypothetical protein
MAEEPDEQKDSEGILDGPSSSQSRYGRLGKNESLEDWITKKEKRANWIDERDGRRGLPRKPLRKSKLNPVSKKQKKRNKEYKYAKEQHYSSEENRVCFCCGSPNNLSIHHKEKRGINTSNRESFITLCIMGNYMDERYPESNHSHSGGCHGWVEANKSQARELGLLK